MRAPGEQYPRAVQNVSRRLPISLYPYLTHRTTSCTNANDKTKGDRGVYYVERWADIYLQDALARLRPQIKGFDLLIEDVYSIQQTCAYEVRGA